MRCCADSRRLDRRTFLKVLARERRRRDGQGSGAAAHLPARQRGRGGPGQNDERHRRAGNAAVYASPISPTRTCTLRTLNQRFVKGAVKAVEDVNALDPQPDFVLFGGDLAQLGRPEELEQGKGVLSMLKAPVKMMVGEHDWFYDMGEKWQELFGPPNYSFDWKGVHVVVLMSVHEKDFWTARKLTPAERMQIVAGLDNGIQSRFEVGEQEREWLKRDLAKVPATTPLLVFSHSPLYKYYRNWNFWTEDAEQVQAMLKPYRKVTVIHGHTHQMLFNQIDNISFYGMLSTAWPWPYAPEGLPPLTVQMNRADPVRSARRPR